MRSSRRYTVERRCRRHRSSFQPTETPGTWVGDMTVEGDRLRVFVMEFIRTGGGGFDFEWVGNAIASFALPGLTLESVTPTYGEGDVMYGAALLEEGGYTYIYGTEDVSGTEKYLHIARATAGNLLEAWEFYTGTGWSSDPNATARLLKGVGNGFGVTKVGKRFVLFTMDSLIPFSDELVLYSSISPSGPFGHRTHVYSTPETRQGWFTYRRPRPPGVYRRDWAACVLRREHLRPARFAFRRRQLSPEIHQGKDRALRPGNSAVLQS